MLFTVNAKSGARLNRHELAKLAAGGWLAILLTATVFEPMGFGRRYLDRLHHRVRAHLNARALRQIDVAVEQELTLRRVIVLSGEVPARDHLAAMKTSQDVAGFSGVRWSATTSWTSAKLPDGSVRHA
ncbi:MAG: hypothetical protein NTW47_00980 [Proteobacteria bacterium]|nr:hypothetical protein [Pseudomonadota bacterium]